MTIDTNELRRLAQAATPGPWWVNRDGLNHGFENGVMEINADDWQAFAGVWAINGAKPSEEGVANAKFIAAANPAAITEPLDRLEAAEADALEQARLNGMGSEREAALMAKLEAAEKDLDLAKQEVANLHDDILELTDECDEHLPTKIKIYGTRAARAIRARGDK